MALIWNAPVGKTADLLETSGKRELFWYGVTVGQVGVGLLVSRERQPTKRAPDPASQVVGEEYFIEWIDASHVRLAKTQGG